LWQTVFSSPAFRARERGIDAVTDELCALAGLAGRRDHMASSLPYGDQRKLEIARAVAIRPRVLLLDEPTAGMNPTESAELLSLLRRLRDELRITIVLVAHDIPLVMNLCERIQVLNFGQLIAEGEPSAIRNNPDVIAAYLGAQKPSNE
jgi:branched-chain amino acid transport system ATP-binding protein